MNMNELALVQRRVTALMHQPLQCVTREREMILFTFGEQRLTLRVQCYYRLMEQGRILMASSDLYQPSEAMWREWEQQGLPPDQVPEDFRPEEPGVNRIDEYLETLNGDLDGLTVKAVILGQLGDLSLLFTTGASLQLMVDTAGGEECWRLMDGHGRQEDLVVYGDGAELVRPEDDGYSDDA